MPADSAPVQPVANGEANDAAVAEQLRAAAELLETVAGNRALLAGAVARGTQAPAQGGGRRLLPGRARAAAAGEGHLAPAQGRQVAARRPGAGGDGHPEAAARKGVHHAQCFPPGRLRAAGNRGRPGFPRSRRAAELLHLQTGLFDHPPFLRPALPGVRGTEFPQAHRTGGSARARGVAHRRARQNRLPGRHQTAALRRATDRDDALSARCGGAVRAGTGLCRVGTPARNLRARSAAHAERGGVLPAPAAEPRPPGFHHQQRLPDRAAAAGFLPAHDGAGERGAARNARKNPPPARRLRRPARLSHFAGRRWWAPR